MILQDKTQVHEDILKGNADENSEGLISRVDKNETKLGNLLVQIGTIKGLGAFLNALILLAIAILGIRLETKPQIIIQQPQSYPQPDTKNQKHSYSVDPNQASNEGKPQEAGNGEGYSDYTRSNSK